MRILSIMLAACLLLSFVGCTAPDGGEPTMSLLESPTEGTSYKGVNISLSGVAYAEEETTLTFIWKNNTRFDVLYGDSFGMEKFVDEQWVALQPKENTGFLSIGYMLKPGAETAKSYTTSWIYGTLEPGTYRFSSGCLVYEDEQGVDCQVWVEFTLGTRPDQSVGTNSAGGNNTSAEPPVLTLKYGTAFKEYTCTTFGKDYNAPNMPRWDELEMLETTEFEAYIEFSQKPDNIQGRCWHDSAYLALDGACEELIMNGNRFSLKPATDGGYIYEITATWSGGNGFVGRATYYFYVASYPVTPIQPRN